MIIFWADPVMLRAVFVALVTKPNKLKLFKTTYAELIDAEQINLSK
ncbi:hypothetical protein APA_1073 [Pseudanabaena sp. lw0831]|nr:hypothetical protein APA_1073 [Pseudanabaena sp. lw0831]